MLQVLFTEDLYIEHLAVWMHLPTLNPAYSSAKISLWLEFVQNDLKDILTRMVDKGLESVQDDLQQTLLRG